jgi:nucleotide-binding universal stress UspA family protein
MAPGMNRPIVVGVDGSGDGLRAVEFAVHEALRRHCGVRLVNAVHDYAPMSPMLPLLSSDTALERSQRILTEATDTAERTSDAIDIETVTRTGPAVHVLLEAAVGARLVVLGHRDLSTVKRIISGSTAVGVAARADCPVVSVSPGWQPNQVRGRVVAGVDGSSASREVLVSAFDAASARDCVLSVLHAWRLPSAYDDLVESRTTVDQWRAESSRVVAEILAGWRQEYPGVPMEVDIQYDHAADALVRASETADLVVVGRHGHGGTLAGWTSMLLGSISRTLLRQAHCPVLVAPHRAEEHVKHDPRAGVAWRPSD